MKYDPESNAFIRETNEILETALPQVMWHITDDCRLSCPYCFAPKTFESTDPSQLSRLVGTLKQVGVQKVDISGGEPLLYRHLSRLSQCLWESEIYATLTTSGVGLELNRRFLRDEIEKFSRVIFSLDGPGELHDVLRGRKHTWSTVLKFISRLSPRIKEARCRINTVVTRPILENNRIIELARIVSDIGVREWCLIQPHPANAKPRFTEYDISEEEFQNAIIVAKERAAGQDIIFRSAAMYSTYWVLHPNGDLKQHTSSPVDKISISLLDESIENILAVTGTANTKTMVPLKEA